MSHVHHELAEEFPNDTKILHDLKMSNAHFAKISNKYHKINREIHRIEAGVEAASDMRTEDLKKNRLLLKDEIAHMILDVKHAVT